MTRFRNYAAIGLASTLVAACGTSGGNNGNNQVAGYPASYSPQHANIQERAASRYDEQTIIQAQRALGEKGFDVGAVDGIWGPSSQSALQNFQQANGMAADGRLGPEVLAALDATNGKTGDTRQSPERRTLAPATDGASQNAAERDRGMSGSRGTSAAAGSDSIDNRQQANNQQGSATRYDQQSGMRSADQSGMHRAEQSGMHNAEPSGMRNAEQPGMRSAEQPGMRRAEQSAIRGTEQSTTTTAAAEGGTNRDLEAFYGTNTVLDVQRTLADRGLEVGRVDGVWGPKSQSALRRFQQDRGLEPSGRINAPTLAALDIAPVTGKRPEGKTR